jgi:hypothetical protein
MHSKPMRLKCLAEVFDDGVLVRSQMYDGTPFELKVSPTIVDFGEPSEGGPVIAYLGVEHIGQQQDRASIVLPGPTLNYGRNVSVSEHQLLPYGLKITDFFIKPVGGSE